MKRASSSEEEEGTLTSPGASAPRYSRHSIGCQRGWYSERVAHPTTSNTEGRHIIGSSNSLMTLFNSGRTLPSKWEDAERWICSPVSGINGINKISNYELQRIPKSKSGPIVPPPLEGGSLTNFVVASPFSTGVIGAHRVYGTGGGRTGQLYPQRSELSASDPFPTLKVKNLRELKDEENFGSGVNVSHRDISIQVSPEERNQSSPQGNLSSSSASNSIVQEQNEQYSSKLQITDVQVDKRATFGINGSKRRGIRINKKRPPYIDEFLENAIKVSTSSFDLAEAAMDISRLQREEAKIAAWEKLHMANAEAAIRKLEMKLEKKRSSSMDKIITKLKTSQSNAHEMRSRLSVNESPRGPKYSDKLFSLHRLIRLGFIRRCFTTDVG